MQRARRCRDGQAWQAFGAEKRLGGYVRYRAVDTNRHALLVKATRTASRTSQGRRATTRSPSPTAISDASPSPERAKKREHRHERTDLVSPVSAMPQAAVQQDHRRAGAEGGVPNARAVMLDV